MTAAIKELPSASTCLAQVVADLELLTPAQLQEIAKGLETEIEVAPVEAIKRHLTAHPARLPQFMALIIRDVGYGKVFEPLGLVDGDAFFKKHMEAILECIGSTRSYCCFAGLQYLKGGERLAKAFYAPHDGESKPIDLAPAQDKVDDLAKCMRAELIPVGSSLIRDDFAAAQAAQRRAVKAEKELKDAELKWAKTQERMTAEAQRAKAKAAAEAGGNAGKLAKAEIDGVQQKLDEALRAQEKTTAQLNSALARLDAIEAQGGATPERVDEIRKEIQRDADQRIEEEISIAVRPWLVNFQAMQKSQAELRATQALSTQSLMKAKQEASRLDIIGNWESDRERALKVLEQEMAELDSLMMRVVKPSPELARMHGELLQAMLACRKQLNPARPLGEVAKALIAGLKKVKDEELGDAAYAVKKLAEKGVFLGLEAETLIKIVDGEKQARYDLTHFKKSVQGRLFERLHAGQDVDMLIDGYNYMFTAHQYFGDNLKLNRNAEGEAVFGEEGRAKLVSLLVPVAEKFPSLRINLFFDGLVKESKQPHLRITLWQPTYQRTGKGQADAEIAHVGLKNIRKGAMAIVVSNDKVVQRHADNYLSVRLFSDFIANH
jgi:hypothetical protein